MVGNTTPVTDIVIGILMEITSILGLFFNGFGLFAAIKEPVLKNSFGRLCLNHCIGNFAANLIHLLWALPLTFTQNIPLATGIYGKLVGQVCIFFWNVVLFSHVFISIDRMVSISVTVRPSCLLMVFRTEVLVTIPWILAFLSIVDLFFYDSCYHVYHPDLWLYSYGDTMCGHVLEKIHFVKNCICLAIMFAVNMVTLYYLRMRHTLQRRRSFTTDDARQMGSTHRKCEIGFFIQTVIQGIVFFCTFVNSFAFRRLTLNKACAFFFAPFGWVLFHTLDGLIMCIFQLKRYNNTKKHARQRTTAMIFVMTD